MRVGIYFSTLILLKGGKQMNNKVKFLRGTSDEYTVAEKDSDAIYFTTDDGKLYIGDKEISGGGSYELPIATTEILGGVMPDGTTITVDENGVISMLGSSGIQMKLLGRYQASTVPIVVIETPIEVGRMFGFYLEGVLKASYFFRIIMTDTGSKTSKFDITSNTGKTSNFTVQTNMSNGAGLQMSFSEFISTSTYINVYDMGIVEVTS